MKSLPITHKALNSPAKVSMEFLVENDAQTHKQFQDIGGDYAKGRKEGLKMTEKKGEPRKKPEPTKTPEGEAKAKAAAEAAAAKAGGVTEIKAAPAP